jgi:hypothetical protein
MRDSVVFLVGQTVMEFERIGFHEVRLGVTITVLTNKKT